MTWNDRDYLLLFACFQILEDFVEKEQGHFYEDVYTLYKEGGFDEAECRRRNTMWCDLRELHAWWQKRKQNKYEDTEENYEEDTEKLVYLIRLRCLLWT